MAPFLLDKPYMFFGLSDQSRNIDQSSPGK